MHRTFRPLVAAVLLTACSESKAPAEHGIGAQAGDIGSDTRVLEEANAAAGEVVRAAGDCEGVKAALPGARERLDALEREVRTATGRTTLGALRKRVNDVAQLCP